MSATDVRDLVELVSEREARILEVERERDAAENRAGELRAAATQAKADAAGFEAERDALRIENVELREQIARLTLAK